MSVLWGTFVNTGAILAGASVGLLVPAVKEEIQRTVLMGIGLAVCMLGIMTALQSNHYLILVFSIAVGGILGEVMKLDKWLDRIGFGLERLFCGGGKRKGRESGQGQGQDQGGSRGFVNATLFFCTGAVAIVGAMSGGLRNEHDILFSKAVLDGFSAFLFASAFRGIGVLLSAIPVLLYEGTIAIAAMGIAGVIDEAKLAPVLAELNGAGGVLILGIGLQMLNVVQIRAANLLPSMAIAAAASAVYLLLT